MHITFWVECLGDVCRIVLVSGWNPHGLVLTESGMIRKRIFVDGIQAQLEDCARHCTDIADNSFNVEVKS